MTTWSAPPVTGMAWEARRAELRTVAAGPRADLRAVRELLALQSSDWAFLVSRNLAEPYGRERATAHRAQLEAALAEPGASEPALRNLAPDASPAALLEPQASDGCVSLDSIDKEGGKAGVAVRPLSLGEMDDDRDIRGVQPSRSMRDTRADRDG